MPKLFRVLESLKFLHFRSRRLRGDLCASWVNRFIIIKLAAQEVSDHLVTWIRHCLAATPFRMCMDCIPSNEASDPISAIQGSVIVALLLFVMNIDLHGELQFSWSMFADDTKIGGKTTDGEVLQSNQMKTAEWAARNCMVINASNSPNLHFGLSQSQILLFQNQNGTGVPLSRSCPLNILMSLSTIRTTLGENGLHRS